MGDTIDYRELDTYKTEDFVLSESFVEWVRAEDSSSDGFWDNWLASHPEKQAEVENARFLILGMKECPRVVDEQEIGKAWESLWQGSSGGNKSRPGYMQLIRIAAILLLTLGAVFATSKIYNENHLRSEDWSKKCTDRGQKLIVYLPDGTKVKLNSQSYIRYQEKYFDKERIVELVGEAFFEVTHNPEIPFVVSTDKTQTTVYGTSFNVNAYPELSTMVSLESGQVKITHQSELDESSIFLHPGEQFTLETTGESNIATVSDFDPKQAYGWKSGYMVFEKSSFEEVIKRLERWYGVDISFQYSEDIPSWKFHGSFHNKSLDYVLETLAYPDLFTYAISGKQVKITYN